MLYQIKVLGIVQGVGFRPFIDRLANRFNLKGTVANRGPYVEILVQGSESVVNLFCKAIENEAPPRAVIVDIAVTTINETNGVYEDFQIVESEREQGTIFVSPDIGICDKCKDELFDKNNRRYLHPFINCTDCGPRLTIMKEMPYDRERTSMSVFPMCNECREEYYNPVSRRYDAQPVCCNDCGPAVYILDGKERGAEAITKVRKIIKNGGIAAIKGIGGFHLACDATNFEAVKRLRERKYRPHKPFAVMAKSLDYLSTHIVNGHQKPIVLLPKEYFMDVAENVAPNNHKLGVMLPYTPLHLLIFDYPDDVVDFPETLVMTSGNVSGAPLATNDEEARRDLSKIADIVLTHNRDILIRSDDSVMDIVDNEPYMIRRSRGYAPLPICVSTAKSISVLAIGGELKNTFCLSKGSLFYMSPYIGDLTDLRTVETLKSSINRMSDLLEISPDMVACDLHPRYHSTQIAESFAKELAIPIVRVQHHYAHILSCLAENDFTEPVIGVAFDGTGYGTDGTIWGGEFMIADVKNFTRLDSIAPFIQAGGDKSSVEGWRIAAAMILDVVGDVNETKKIAAKLSLIDESKINGQLYMIHNNVNCIKSTSAGRLFDAVSALLGICTKSTFEGEAAMKLQYKAECGATNVNLINSSSTRAIFADLLNRRLNGEDTSKLAFAFHAALASYIANTCQKIRDKSKISTVALSGGVFQNTLLLTLTMERLTSLNFKVLRHKMIPPNDGGIALGQCMEAHFDNS